MEQARIAQRIEVVDVIRGFAIMAILLLHNIEHFDFINRPDYLPDFVKAWIRAYSLWHVSCLVAKLTPYSPCFLVSHSFCS